MNRLRRWWAPLLVLACAGCGLPASGNPHRIAPSDVPFGLLGTRAFGSPVSPQQGPTTHVFFIRGGRLIAVPRRVIGDNVPAEAVRALLDGPTSAEASGGLTSDIPSGTRLVSLDLNRATATLDLSPEFGNVGGSDQVLATAELVYTVTASPYINKVTFTINGKPIEVPDGTGSLGRSPRGRSDYRSLAPGR